MLSVFSPLYSRKPSRQLIQFSYKATDLVQSQLSQLTLLLLFFVKCPQNFVVSRSCPRLATREADAWHWQAPDCFSLGPSKLKLIKLRSKQKGELMYLDMRCNTEQLRVWQLQPHFLESNNKRLKLTFNKFSELKNQYQL